MQCRARISEILKIWRLCEVLEVGEVVDEGRLLEVLVDGKLVEVHGVAESLDELGGSIYMNMLFVEWAG